MSTSIRQEKCGRGKVDLETKIVFSLLLIENYIFDLIRFELIIPNK